MEDTFEKIIDLNNGFEASLLEEVLTDRDIPFIVRSYADTAYDGVFQVQLGWGHLEAPLNFKDEIISIYNDIISQK